MSVVCILTPVVVAAWPAFGAAVTAAATSMGYTLMEHGADQMTSEETRSNVTRVNLEVDQSEIITDQLARASSIEVERDGVIVRFSRDARGHAKLCVEGETYSKDQLKQFGEELSQRVVQQYVYQRLMDEFEKRDFLVVDNETDSENRIRLKVRHWDN